MDKFDVKPLALSPTPLYTKLVGDLKEPASLFEKSRGHRPRCCGLACFTCIHWLGAGVGEIIYGRIAAAIGAFTG